MPEQSTTPSPAQGGRGRGRGRGEGSVASTDQTSSQLTSRGRRGGGGGGGGRGGGQRGSSGRGGGGRQNRGSQEEQQAGRRQRPRSGAGRDGETSHEPPDPGTVGPRAVGNSGDRLTGAAKRAEGEGKGKESGAVEDDDGGSEVGGGELCFICASPIEHTAIAPCNHRTCHICSLRLRALYKTKACAHCRTESSFMIFTDDPAKRYEDFKDSDFVRTDDNLGIKYETVDIFEDTVILLRYNCPDKDCDAACLGWPDLHRHVKSKHGKVMCDLCIRNKKVFTHEHDLFSVSQLRKHERVGDDNPGAVDQSGFKGHPECGFCRQRFYGDDELYTHCRDKHERCHICDRRSEYRQHQYYIDYNALEEHFNAEHHLCLDKECLEKKFVVFESQMDLKAHQLEAHPAGLSKDARRDARLVDLSDFDYRSSYQPPRGRRGGAGRGRDPNSEPIPSSSAQPLRRDELAYQRQMAIQSAQSVSTRTFGGQLTRNDGPPSQPVTRPSHQPPTPPTTDQSLPAIETLDIGPAPAPSTPQEQARRIAHEGVINRAASLLHNDQLKLNDFRNKVSAYRKSVIDATNLIEGFFSLFDTSPAELGKLVKELAHLYEDESKRTSLLQAWNDWRAINEDYPSLPGPSGTTPLTSSTAAGSGAGGKRVLRLKSSTGPSSRSAVGQQGSLASRLGSGNRNVADLFPPLGGGLSNSSRSKPTAAWGGAGVGTSASATPPSRSSPVPSRSASRTPTTSRPGMPSGGSDAFPALPAAPKPNTLMAGLTRGTVRWDERPSNAANAWGRGNPSAADADAGGDSGAGELSDKKGKGKKGKGKGQVLYHFG